MPRLCEFYPGICLTTEEKARKNLSQGKKNLSQVKENLSHDESDLKQVPTEYNTGTTSQNEQFQMRQWQRLGKYYITER
jgi:hypothetical protein